MFDNYRCLVIFVVCFVVADGVGWIADYVVVSYVMGGKRSVVEVKVVILRCRDVYVDLKGS